MTIEQLGSLGELIGAILVLVTLVFLASQLRAQNAIARSDGHRDLIKQLASLHARLGQDDYAALLVRGWQDLESLDHQKRTRFDIFLHEYLHICEQAFYMGKDRYLPAGAYDAFMNAGAVFIGPPGARSWWQHSRVGGYALDFVELIEALRDEQGDALPQPWEILPPFR